MKAFNSLIFLGFILSALTSSHAADIITTNQFLLDGQTIISTEGNFELGFFSPDPDNNSSRYLGIWYKKVSRVSVVWVGNRDVPLNDTSGFLQLTQQGILQILTNRTNSVIWSSSFNSTVNSNNPVAHLLDSGNFVVREASDDSPENFFWESFDHPDNTILPGVKFGLNLAKGINRYLQSWKSNNDPSRGNYIFRFDSHGFPQEFLLNGSVKRFRSGPWNGLRFSGSPGLKPNQIYTYGFVNTPEEIYYKFDLINSAVYTRLVFNPDGVLHRLTWNNRTGDWQVYLSAPADRCDEYGLCGAYGFCFLPNSPVCSCLDRFVPQFPEDWQRAEWSGGCVRRTPLDCQKGDGFRKYSGIKLPDTQNSWYDLTTTLKECEKMCLNNCSCTAYSNTDIRGRGSGCLLWFDDLIDIVQFNENGQDIYIRLASSEIGTSSAKVKIIGITLGLVGGLLLLALILILYFRKKKKEKRQTEQQIDEDNLTGKVGGSSEQLRTNASGDDLELPLIDLDTIVKATNNFSTANKLGEGGFGPVYKGVMTDGQEIAVKRLSEYSVQGTDEFKNEVKCIAQLQHRNLVKLLGCCIQAEEKMLIYEFMPNKSLDFFIFEIQELAYTKYKVWTDDNRGRLLNWPMRYQIITGIARGILYLHQDSRLRIVHRDLKASNILLDIDMKPKISDFGMARIFGGTETEGNTKRVVGTYGYMSPEYAVDGYFSTKSDVFSYGVLVIEIVTGRKNRGYFHPDHHHNLLGHAWLLHKEGRFQELVDPQLTASCYLSEVIRSIHIALLCVQQSPEDRPTMSSVVFLLASEGALPMPKEPGFFTERNLFFEPEKSSSTKPPDTSSSNNFSITLLSPR